MKDVNWRRWTVLPIFIFLLVPGAVRAGSAAMPSPAASPTVTPELLAGLDTTVPAAMITFDIPGAATALIQDGQVVYAKGFGVRNRTTGEPFTPDTVHRIASTTKAMTAMLVATQVDAGLFDWDTPVQSIYPDFQLPTPDLTSSVTVRQLMGMGTGLGENPIELYFDRITPRRLVAGLATLPVLFPPGTAFHHNNTVYAMGGYVGALAAAVESAWTGAQHDLAQLLPGARHAIAEQSGHYIQQDQPELVIEAVRQVVESVRHSVSP